jgi:hypothetical protein
MYKVVMFGDRFWDNDAAVAKVIKKLLAKYGTDDLLIIEGGAGGADTASANLARKSSIHVAEVKALWDTRHRSAGPQRNDVMAALEPDEAFCFHPDLSKSKGSADMKRKLDKLGIKVTVITK